MSLQNNEYLRLLKQSQTQSRSNLKEEEKNQEEKNQELLNKFAVS